MSTQTAWLDDLGKPKPAPLQDETSRRIAHVVEHEAQKLTSWSERRTREFGEDVARALTAAGLVPVSVRGAPPDSQETSTKGREE